MKSPRFQKRLRHSEFPFIAAERGGITDLDGAFADYTKAIEIDPRNPIAYSNRGNAREDKGDLDGAIADHKKAIEVDGTFAAAYNNLAWLLATSWDASVRDGTEAVKYALKATELSKWQEPTHLGTLAAAYAEVEERLRPDKTSQGLYFSETEMNFVCPWHGMEYDMKTGECVSDRKMKLRSYKVLTKGDEVYVVA